MLDRIKSDADEPHGENALIPRATIEEIVGHRNKALELYGEAFDAIAGADDKIKAAHKIAALASPGITSFTHERAHEVEAFQNAVKLPDRAQYLRTARKLLDINVWAWVIKYTELERLMDKEAKDTLHNQMRYVPEQVDRETGQLITGEEVEKGMPPVTVDNIRATLQQFMVDAETIFRRGMANAFSKLDRRFRSHDGFKIGNRVVLMYAFDGSGYLGWGGFGDTLMDIERAFAVLDGDMTSSYSSTLFALEQDRRHGSGPRQSLIHTHYFKIRVYKNGNAHLWFERDDLVEKVNKLLAEYYGEVIGDGQAAEDDPLADKKTTPAKYFGFYPTPDGAASHLMGGLRLYREKNEPRIRILEPSAGRGNLARRCFVDAKERRERLHDADNKYRWDPIVDCVEIQPHLAEQLKADPHYRRVYCGDFLKLSPKTTGLYNLVVMNPPFDRERDIDHVVHALDFLEPDGFLTAIMSAGTEFRETRKSQAFRALVERMNGKWDDLPPGSFSSVGTNINTMRLRVYKDGRTFYR